MDVRTSVSRRFSQQAISLWGLVTYDSGMARFLPLLCIAGLAAVLTAEAEERVTSGPDKKLVDAVTKSNEISIEAWVKPENTSQNGSARIVSLSADPGQRNFTLSQDAARYDVRLRTDRVSVHDLHATMLHLLGLDHKRLTYFHNGRNSA